MLGDGRIAETGPRRKLARKQAKWRMSGSTRNLRRRGHMRADSAQILVMISRSGQMRVAHPPRRPS